MCLVNISKRRPSDGLHSCRHDDEVQFYSFDILVSDDEDVRSLPLSMRNAAGAPGSLSCHPRPGARLQVLAIAPSLRDPISPLSFRGGRP